LSEPEPFIRADKVIYNRAWRSVAYCPWCTAQMQEEAGEKKSDRITHIRLKGHRVKRMVMGGKNVDPTTGQTLECWVCDQCHAQAMFESATGRVELVSGESLRKLEQRMMSLEQESRLKKAAEEHTD
jgi:hypothetical protein